MTAVRITLWNRLVSLPTLSWLLAVAMFFLIALGGLVTTQDAGMAVPDWPGTYGYNMFAYPISTWLYGPLDLFIEHGHRLLGSFVGLLSIAVCIIVWVADRRRWLFGLNVLLLIFIIVQGVLGGVRVLADARTIAMIHGCFAPLVFAFACSLVLIGGTKDNCDAKSVSALRFRRLRWMLLLQTVLVVLQLIIGAQLRHALPWTSPSAFTGLVHLHLTLAVVVTLLIVANAWTVIATLRKATGREARRTRTFAILLALLIIAQIGLGLATWVANYAFPWSDAFPAWANLTLATKGYWESWITTGHQATGSLIIAFSSLISLSGWRLHEEPHVQL